MKTFVNNLSAKQIHKHPGTAEKDYRAQYQTIINTRIYLQPVGEVLLVGKYLSGVLTTSILFVGMTAVTLFLVHAPRGFSTSMRYIFQGPGLMQIVSYLSIAVLACLGYGAIFLVIGLFFRNPIVPALLVYGWEGINFLLPPILKRFSVIFYLQSLTPVPMSEGPFAIVATPSPVWVAVPLLVALSAAVLFIASLRIRRMEIRYAGE